MEDYGRIIGKITSTPWLITPEALKMMLEIFDAHLSGTITHEEIRLRLQDSNKGYSERATRHGSVGVLALSGPIFPKANLMTELSGATSIEQFQSDFRQMMADESIDSILLNIDSPGGMSSLIDEMATEIREARDTKPVFAIANTSMNSAAYYIGSQATRVYATPSGQLGSVGTYMVHTDETELLEKVGVKQTVIKAGRFKAVTEEPLTPEGRTYLQDYVNAVNDQFVEAVAKGRDTTIENVRNSYGEGGIVTPQSALERGMIDDVATYDQVVDLISTGGVYTNSTNQSNAFGTRMSYEAGKEHSEPGTGQGGEPTPREAPEEGDPAIEGGWRRDSPPAAYEMEEIVNREWIEARASSLGIDFSSDTTDEELAELVASRMDDIVVPLTSATAEAEKQRAFAEAYPEQAAQMNRLLAESRKNEAVAFADGFRVFESDPKKGYSTLVRNELRDAYIKVGERTFSHEDLKSLMDAVTSGEAIVPLGETGSSRTTDGTVVTPQGTMQEVRKQFATLVREAMEQDNLTRDAAINHVSEQHPDLAKAYIESH